MEFGNSETKEKKEKEKIEIEKNKENNKEKEIIMNEIEENDYKESYIRNDKSKKYK